MIVAILAVLGLCFGSFVNAFVWRLYKQTKQQSKKSKSTSAKSSKKHSLGAKRYSIVNGRSMCVHCEHELSAKDLVPIFSWLSLRGKCRYCSKPVSWQYPLVELATGLLFVISYLFWPAEFVGLENLIFGLWLIMLIGFMSLIVYDIRWMILPNKVVFGLYIVGLVIFALRFVIDPQSLTFYETLAGVLVGGGIFYILFQVSKGKWIGGGDVKLGFLLGLLVARPDYSFLVLFLASLLGCLVVLPSLLSKKLHHTSKIPFGPFLIVATIIVFLFGNDILVWYFDNILLV